MALSNVFTDRKRKYAKEVQSLYDGIIAELGGPDGTTEMQRQLAQRAAVLIAELRKLECIAATDGATDLDLYGKVSSTLSRLMRTLRDRSIAPQKIDRDASVALREYLEQTTAQKRHVKLVK